MSRRSSALHTRRGGDTMSDDLRRGVADSTLDVHGYQQLRMIDAGLLTTSLRVNCQGAVVARGCVVAELFVKPIDRRVAA
ncbi:GMC oxidoreductase [Geodermatophilus sp. SYSU D01186]